MPFNSSCRHSRPCDAGDWMQGVTQFWLLDFFRSHLGQTIDAVYPGESFRANTGAIARAFVWPIKFLLSHYVH